MVPNGASINSILQTPILIFCCEYSAFSLQPVKQKIISSLATNAVVKYASIVMTEQKWLYLYTETSRLYYVGNCSTGYERKAKLNT